MQNKIAILLPYKDQFIKDNAGSASIWVKDFSKKVDIMQIPQFLDLQIIQIKFLIILNILI